MATCVACHEPARHPKLLSCLHSVCSRCVEHIARDPVTVSCPRCLRLTSVPSVFSLPDNYLSAVDGDTSATSAVSLSYDRLSGVRVDKSSETQARFCEECAKESEATSKCLDCGLVMCGVHTHSHQLSRATAHHQIQGTAATEDSGESRGQRACPRCPLHPSKSLSFFCKTCCKVLCEQCREAGAHGGQSHNVISSSEAAREQREELSDMLRKISQPSKSTEIRNALDEVVSTINALNSAVETASAEIERNVEELISMLQQRERELLEKLEELRWRKLEPLENQREDLEKRLSDAERTNHYSEMAVKDLSDEQLLESTEWLRDNLQSVASFEYKGPAGEGYLAFVAKRASIDACITDGFGVFISKQLDPTLSILEPPPKSHSLVDGRTIRTLLTAFAVGGEQFMGDLGETSMKVEVTNSNNEPVQVQVEQEGPNSTVSFTPDGTGQYKVVAIVNDHHIQGSPLTLDVEPFSPELILSWRQAGGQFYTVESGSPITLPQDDVASEKPFQIRLIIRGKKEEFTVITDIGCHISTSQLHPSCNRGIKHNSDYSNCSLSGSSSYQPGRWKRRIQVNLTCPGCSHSAWYCPGSSGSSDCSGIRNCRYWQVPLSLQTSFEGSQSMR